MKARSRLTRFLANALVWGGSVFCCALPAHAARLWWDGDGAGTVGGGSGTWDLSLSRWCATSNGNTYQAWVNNTPADDAVFQNAAGTVTQSATVAAGDLTFNTANYILLVNGFTVSATNLSGTGANSLTVRSTSSTAASKLALNPASDLTWSGTLEANSTSGSQTLTVEKSGAGTTLTLNGTTKPSNGSSGARIEFSVLGGTLKLGDNIQMTSRDTATSAGNIRLTIASGATFDINGGNKKAGAGTNLTFSSLTLPSGGTLTDTRSSGDPVTVNIGIGSTTTLTLTGDITGRLSIGRSDGSTKNLTLKGSLSITGDVNGTSLVNFNTASPFTVGGSLATLAVLGTDGSIGALSGAGTVDLGSTTLTLGNSAGNDQSHSGAIYGTGGTVIKGGSNTQTLSGTNFSSGNTTVTGGTLIVNGGGVDSVAASGLRTSSSSTITNLSVNTSSIAIGQPISGTGIPVGAYVVARTATNAVTISANATSSGTSSYTFAAGAGLGLGAVVVNRGGTLGGNGSIKPPSSAGVSINGTLAPGAGGIGTITFDLGNTTSNVDLYAGATILAELGTPGTGDQVRFLNYTAGDLALNGNTVNVINAGGLASGTYTLFSFYSDGGVTPAVHGITSGLVLGTGLEAYAGSKIVYGANGGTTVDLQVAKSGGSVLMVR